MAQPPNTGAQLSHAMTIRVGSETIGAINEWNPRINRTITHLYEFGPVDSRFADVSGDPFEAVPGNVGGLQIDMRRWDLYTSQLETAFGTYDVTMLSKQAEPMGIREAWTVPRGSSGSAYFRIYSGCWWQDIGRTIDAKGERTVNAGGTITYTSRKKIENASTT